MPEPLFFGNQSMAPVCLSVGVCVLVQEGAPPESIFRRDKVPARNTNRFYSFVFANPKSYKGRFFKNESLVGYGTGSRKIKAGGRSLKGSVLTDMKKRSIIRMEIQESEEKRDGKSASCRPFASKELV